MLILVGCPSCGDKVEVPLAAVQVIVDSVVMETAESGEYRFTCPKCFVGVRRKADRMTLLTFYLRGVTPVFGSPDEEADRFTELLDSDTADAAIESWIAES